MRKELITAVAAAFVLGFATAIFPPVDAFAAGKDKKEAPTCDSIKDSKKKAACLKKAKAKAQYNKEVPKCNKIKDSRKRAKCFKAEKKGQKKQGKN